jgi:hypothetical protein
MAHLKLENVLNDLPGVRKDGAAYLFSEELDVTLYASVGEETLQVSRASRIELSADVVVVLTHKGERFYLPADRFVALKTGNATKTTLNAGFRA